MDTIKLRREVVQAALDSISKETYDCANIHIHSVGCSCGYRWNTSIVLCPRCELKSHIRKDRATWIN